jgi:hypothetical protein
MMIRTGDLYKFYKTGKPDALKKYIRSNKTQINNDVAELCTLNTMIRIMLSENLSSFNLGFIQVLVDHGSKPINGTDSYNTLTSVLMLSEKYLMRTLKNDQIRAEQNLINLYNLLIDCGSEPNILACVPNDILACVPNDILRAIKTKNVKIIELICSRFAIDLADHCHQIHHDYCYYSHNPLTHAVQTNDPQIVKIVLKYGARPDISDTRCNTLLQAIGHANYSIIREIVLIGGYMKNYVGCQLSIYRVYWPGEIHEVMDLIMCSGSKLSLEDFKYLMRIDGNESMNDYMLDYFRLMHHESSANLEDDKRINELRAHLKYVMDQLHEQGSDRKIKIQLLLGTPLPECCIDMIIEYQNDGIRYIDWLKY